MPTAVAVNSFLCLILEFFYVVKFRLLSVCINKIFVVPVVVVVVVVVVEVFQK